MSEKKTPMDYEAAERIRQAQQKKGDDGGFADRAEKAAARNEDMSATKREAMEHIQRAQAKKNRDN